MNIRTTFTCLAAGLIFVTAACEPLEPNITIVHDVNNSDTGADASADTSTSVDAAPLPCAGKDCDDKNECTTDKCDEATGACVNQKQTGVLCNDNNACTEGDMCNSGQCMGTAKDCEDGDKCTINGCDAKTGKCASQDKTGCIPDKACDAADCDDGNACTDDFCNANSQCVHVNDDGNTCVDDNKCTTGDSCKAGTCSGVAKSCNDNNACTTDACDPKTGECVYAAVSNAWKEPCSDYSEATVNDTCIDGKCIGEIPSPKCVAANCDDGNKCTTDYCSAGGQCAHATTTADGAICAPATSSANYMCQSGICQAFLKPECTYNTDCSDKNWCTDDFCIAGKCKWNAKVCNDGNSCTMDSCDPQASTTQGCVFTAIPGCGLPAPECSLNSQCNDNQPCTDDACVAGKCSHEWKPFCCNSDNECKLPGACFPGKCLSGSCNFTPTQFCNDNNSCTSDSCSNGACVFKPIPGCGLDPCAGKNCSDGNACTLDLCEAGNCKYVADVGKTCNDNNACTISDICIAGAFCSGTPKSCNDSDPCTTDSCNANGQCVNSAVPGCVAPCTVYTNCSDNNFCTKDSCNAGSGKCDNLTITCDDNNACTSDSCNVATGCVFTAIPGCGVDPCAGKNCNDNNPCTTDTCSTGTCSFAPIPGCGAQGTATPLTITWFNDAGALVSLNEKGVDKLNLLIECKQSANVFLDENDQIPWNVWATSLVNATSLSKNFSTKALTQCKVNVLGTKQGLNTLWLARGGEDPIKFPNGKAIQGTISYIWNGISVVNVGTGSNGQGGYDWKFSPGGDSDGDGINDLQDPFKYDGSK